MAERRGRLHLPAEDPEQLRGPQFDAAWCDELAKWRHVDATFDMLQFGLRLGQRPRQLITTTPRPILLIKRLIVDPRTAVTRASTHANAAHLSPAFLRRSACPLFGNPARPTGDRWRDHRGPRRCVVDAHSHRSVPHCSRTTGSDARRCRYRSTRVGASGRRCMRNCRGRHGRGRARSYVLEDATVAGLAALPVGPTKAVALFHRLQGRRHGRRGQHGRGHGARRACAG